MIVYQLSRCKPYRSNTPFVLPSLLSRTLNTLQCECLYSVDKQAIIDTFKALQALGVSLCVWVLL